MVEVKVQESLPPKKQERPNPINEIKSHLKIKMGFTGTAKSFLTLIKNKNNKEYFNTFCENNKLNKSEVVKQILK
jgi:hypothetical protein